MLWTRLAGYLALLKWENPAPLSADPEEYFFTTPNGAPVEVTNFHKREWLPMLRRLQIRPRPFYKARHSYVSFLYSIGARSGFISSQTGDSIKTLEPTTPNTSKRPTITAILSKNRSKKVQPR